MSPPPSPTRDRQALIAALTAVLLWSTVASGFKLGLQILAPIQLLWLGVAISTFFFVLYEWRTGFIRPAAAEWRTAAGFGLVNPCCYYLVLFEAYARLPAQIAQPLNYTWAIALALLAVPLLHQPLSARRLAGILLSYGGVVVLLRGASAPGAAALDPVGIGLALLSTLLWAGYWLMNARSTMPAVRLLTLSFLCALPVLTLLCALTTGLPTLNLATLGYGAWVGLIEMGITFVLWQQALRLTSNAALIGQLIFLSPFLSLLLIHQLVGETIHPASFMGLGIIVAGLLVSGRPVAASAPV